MQTALDIARVLRWQDVLDVAILTFALYRAYLWLRGTVALQVVTGMIVLVVGAFVATEIGLMLTAYVLQALGAVLTLVAVVIFRDEIRLALRRANPMRWWRRRRNGAASGRGLYVDLGTALFALAQRRIGALVVVPGADPLREHLTGGIEVDALVSPEMFEAIFVEASPIHDGAAVMAGNRVRLAGAFLPLSTSGDLPDRYGTRHRAAVGLSEACDAVVLVVSEERGIVSLARAGRVEVVSDPDELAGRIERALADSGPPSARRASTIGEVSSPTRRRVLDLGVLAAIVLSVSGAWYVVAGDRNTVITPSVPLELRNLPDGLEVDAPRPAEITLQLRGPRKLLMTSGSDEVGAYVDLADVEPGRHRLEVSTSAAPGIEVENVTPKRVVIRAREQTE